MEQTHGNYDLYFNRHGVLLHSVHMEKNNNFKAIYGYNRKGVLISIMTLLSEKNELLSMSEFEYDKQGRIETETDRSFFYNPDEVLTTEYIHTYADNKEEIFMSSDSELDEDEYTEYLTYDNKLKVIEDKLIRNEEELVWWNKTEYNSTGEIAKEFSLNSRGEPDGVYAFLKTENGMSKGYNFTSERSNYLREYDYTFNKQGHWIHQVMLNDGEPRYFYDRAIEYY
jgi:hypothetical protein